MRSTPGSASILLGLLAVALAAGCVRSGGAESGSAPPVPSVQFTRARRSEIARAVTLPGNVRAEQEVMLYAKVGGYLHSIRVDEGDRVREGEVLAEIEVPELVADLARSRAEAGAARAEYERMRVAGEKAPDLVVPQDLEAAKARSEGEAAGLSRVQTLLGYARITAPFSGVITERWLDAGALVPAGTSSSSSKNAAVVSLADFSRVRVEVSVPGQEVSFVRTGLPVTV